jgi:drug/metabolite transporter (DMT)-like permease
MVVVVSAMFYHMGLAVVFQVVLYVSCLAFVKIAMKEVYAYNFRYPKFVTSLHLLLSSLAGFAVLVYRRIKEGKPIATPTTSELCFSILPIALTFGLSIGAENSALVFVSAAFSEVVAASNPVMSAFVTWAFGMPFFYQLLAPILVVVIGCVISITGEMYFSSFGLTLLLFSVLCRALKAVMQQKLMTGEMKEKFDPCTLMAWTCLYCFIEMIIYSAAVEGKAPYNAFMAAPDATGLSITIGLSALIACTLNISALYVIKQLGAVGMQMVSQMKSLLVVIGGMALLDESFTAKQQMGFATVLAGVYWYSHVKRVMDPNSKGH